MPEAIIRTDQAVAHIGRLLEHVIKVYYLTHASSEIKAVQCHCSRATFWRRVERGQFAVYRNLLTTETDTAKFGAILQALSA